MKLLAQVEDHQSPVFQNAASRRVQMITQFAVMIEPPQSRPAEDHEVRSRRPQPLQFPNSGLAVRRRPPVLAISFDEWDGAATDGKVASEHAIVGKDQRLPRRYDRSQLLCRPVVLIEPPPGSAAFAEERRLAILRALPLPNDVLDLMRQTAFAQEFMRGDGAAIERVVIVEDHETSLDDLVVEALEATTHAVVPVGVDAQNGDRPDAITIGDECLIKPPFDEFRVGSQTEFGGGVLRQFQRGRAVVVIPGAVGVLRVFERLRPIYFFGRRQAFVRIEEPDLPVMRPRPSQHLRPHKPTPPAPAAAFTTPASHSLTQPRARTTRKMYQRFRRNHRKRSYFFNYRPQVTGDVPV